MDAFGQPLRAVHTHELKVCEHQDIIHHIEYDFYSRRLALVSSDKIVSVYTKMPENKGWTKTGQFKVSGGATLHARWAHPSYGQVLATASYDGSIFIFQEIAKFNAPLEVVKGELIQCEWKQRSHILSMPPASVTDIKFAPHFFGLMLGACDSAGHVIVYEAQNTLSLDSWLPTMKLNIFEHRCKAMAFSTDRFNTLLMAACTDDDRCRVDKRIALFPFTKNCDVDVPPPDITYLNPAANLSVLMPPTDLDFSPTGAYAFQRLAIAIGPCIVIYNVNAVPLDKFSRLDSPQSTLSESSNNTVIMAPTISITKPKSDGEEQKKDELSLDSLNLDSTTKEESKDAEDNQQIPELASSLDSKQKKSVQFKFDPDGIVEREPSPVPKKPVDESNFALSNIKSSLKKIKSSRTEENQFRPEEFADMKEKRKQHGSDSMDVEASASDDITSPSPICDDQSSAQSRYSSAFPKHMALLKDNDEEKADEADSETSDAPLKCKTSEEALKGKGGFTFDPRGIYTDLQPIGPEIAVDPSQVPPPSPQRKPRVKSASASSAADAPTRTIPRKHYSESKSSPTHAKVEKVVDSSQKEKSKHTKSKKKRRSAEGNDKNEEDVSSSSDDVKTTNKNQKHKTEKAPIYRRTISTTEFRKVDGHFESAVITFTSTDASGMPEEMPVESEEESDKMKIITLRQAVLRAGKSQAKRISFNHTGSLITAVYADGRVRVWKRINPVLWHCASVIDPPDIKGQGDINVTTEGAYY
uniref:Uncharacterized protein n=1 Tax=Panagrolaimus sp. JU765 TaxID=591449 RepID=A0AC34QJZ0_9BILA